MNNILKLYEEHIDELNRHLETTMREIEGIQRQSVVLDMYSRELIADLMSHYARIHTIIVNMGYKIENLESKISREEEA